MSDHLSRRSVLTGAAAAGLAGFVHLLPPIRAAAPPRQRIAAVSDDLEPLVRMIEDSPREKLIEKAVASIKSGTSYSDLLSALFLAGVRGIQPRPVGFKFHAVLVVNSAHQASLAAADKERWLPLLWSLDNFKGAQIRNRKEGDWRLAPPAATLPSAATAARELAAGMDEWDVDRTDRAVTALARSEGTDATFGRLWHYACRDWRDIGHKPIFAAGAYRMLNTIGARHAEPVLRCLAYALLDHEGGNPAKRDSEFDRSGRANLPRARKLASKAPGNKSSTAVSLALLATMREASPDDAGKEIETLIGSGTSPAAIWDGLFLAGGELLMRQPGIIALHALTSLNALHFIHRTAAAPEDRAFALLQAGAYVALFRQRMARGEMAKLKLDKLEATEPLRAPVRQILAGIRKCPVDVARLALTLDAGQGRELMAAARALIFAKGVESHDYKFCSAAFEDYFHVAPALRPMFLAASTFYLRGTSGNDSPVFTRAKAALA